MVDQVMCSDCSLVLAYLGGASWPVFLSQEIVRMVCAWSEDALPVPCSVLPEVLHKLSITNDTQNHVKVSLCPGVSMVTVNFSHA